MAVYNMNAEVIKKLLIDSCNKLIESEHHLLENDSSERSIAHRLACIIGKLIKNNKMLGDFSVDCEYNIMNGGIPKAMYGLTDTEIPKGKYVFPDIIVHKRGNNENNLAVLEIKKSTSSYSLDFDRRKIDAYVGELNYRFGFCLLIIFGSKFKTEGKKFSITYEKIAQQGDAPARSAIGDLRRWADTKNPL